MKKNLLWIFMLMMWSVAGIAQTNMEFVGDTTIVDDVVISSEIDTVFVGGNIYVDTIGSLTIEPGVVFVFEGNYLINVEGSIVAEGTEDEPIIFTLADTTGFYDNTHVPWAGIEIVEAYNESDADPSSFDYCEFYFADADDDDYNTSGGAILVVDYDHLTVSNCVFKHNIADQGAAIHTRNSIIRITDCLFDANLGSSEGGSVNISGSHPENSSKVYMTGCTFLNSTGNYGGAFRAVCGRNHYIANNVFQYNYGDQGGAVLFGGEPDSTLFINNFLSNNTADTDGGGGLRTSGYCTPIVMNNIIVNNTTYGSGGGVKIGKESSPILINNTIANNTADEYGGGLFTSCETDSSMIYNTIIYGNSAADTGDQVYIKYVDDGITVSFYNCNIEGDSMAFVFEDGNSSQLVYEGNIDENPVFVNPTATAGINVESMASDWKLAGTSLCLEAGMAATVAVADFPETDYFGNVRTIAGTIDIGAHEFELVRTVSIEAPVSELVEGGTLQLIAVVTPENATNKELEWSITTGSENATIDQSGLLTASSVGSVTVQVETTDGSDLSDDILININVDAVETESISESIRIFPNPVKDMLTVEFEVGTTGTLQVLDLQGKLILSNEMNQNQMILDVSMLNEGMYLLRIDAAEGIYTQKFIVE